MILSRIAFGAEPKWQDVEREGITSITSELIDIAENAELRFKHIAQINKIENQIHATVKPVLVCGEHPFYHVEGVQNAVHIHSDIVGEITLQGPGAGMFPTASAVIEDLVYVSQHPPAKRSLTSEKVSTGNLKKDLIKEVWLVHGLSYIETNSLVTKVEQLAEKTFILRAAKHDLEQITCQHAPLVYYPILGEYAPAQQPPVLTVL